MPHTKLIMKHLVNQHNMKSVFIFISIFVLFSVVSCSPAKNDSQQTPRSPVLPQPQEQKSSAITETPATKTPEVVNPPSSEEKSAQVVINPPHGQPGHRCDIPVGAPLNSSPVNSTRQITGNPSTNSSSNIATNPTSPTLDNARRLNSSQPRNTTSVKNSGKINPPHGQPFHRCDIPVGSPLP